MTVVRVDTVHCTDHIFVGSGQVLLYCTVLVPVSYAPRISFLEIRSKFGSILQNRKIYWSYRYYVLKTKSASKTFHSSITLRFFFSFFTCIQYIITRTPIDFKIEPTLDRVSKKEIRGA